MLSRHLAIHARIQDFSSGGRGPGQSDKKALTTVFLVLSLFYLISKKTIICQGSRGGPTFSGGGGGGGESNFFQGGPIAYTL